MESKVGGGSWTETIETKKSWI